MTNNWFDALGKEVSNEGFNRAVNFLIKEGYPEIETTMALQMIARDIKHDNPNLAIKETRSFFEYFDRNFGNETLVIRTLAELCSDIPIHVPMETSIWGEINV